MAGERAEETWKSAWHRVGKESAMAFRNTTWV
jgi:hypothetical protein